MGGIIHRCSVASSGCRKEMPGDLDVTRDENGVRGNFHGCVAAAWVATSMGGGPCTVHARDGQTPSAEERGLQALQNVQIATGWGSRGSSRIREKIWLCSAVSEPRIPMPVCVAWERSKRAAKREDLQKRKAKPGICGGYYARYSAHSLIAYIATCSGEYPVNQRVLIANHHCITVSCFPFPFPLPGFQISFYQIA